MYTIERGETIEFLLNTTNLNNIPINPDSISTNITNASTNKIIPYVPTIPLYRNGNYKLKIASSTIPKGTYYTVITTKLNEYIQKKYFTLKVQDHEATQ